jgi:hypothetical protein
MAPAEILRVREHVDSCPNCRGKLAQAHGNAAVLKSWIDPEPDEHELVLFVAGNLPADRAGQIEAHVANCSDCQDAVQDLRTFASAKAVTPLPARSRPVPLWWGAIAATVLISVYAISQSGKPHVIASLRDGAGTVTLTRSGELNGLPGASEQERVLVAEALHTGRISVRANAGASNAGVLRGSQDNQPFHLFDPMARRMLTDRPEFRWSPLEGAASYTVTVFTDDEKIVEQATVTDTHWQPSSALPRGGPLYWQVTAQRGGQQIVAPAPPAPRASFEIVSQETVERLRQSGSGLRAAIAFAQEGLRVEALEAMNSVVAANPDSALAKQLRDSLFIK